MSSGPSGIRAGAAGTHPQAQSPLLEREMSSPFLLGNTPPASDSDDDEGRVPDLGIRVRIVDMNDDNSLLRRGINRVERVATPFPGAQDPPRSLSATLGGALPLHSIVRPLPLLRPVSQPTTPTQNPPEGRRGGPVEKRDREE